MLINKMTVKSGKRDEVTAVLIESAAAFESREECIMSLVTHDADDPDVIWVQDVWTDEGAHQAAMSTPSMQEFVRQAIPLLEGMPEQHRVYPTGGKTPTGFPQA
ncbi:putative quinol monooxygenase [Gryllotalpicola koreensis]